MAQILCNKSGILFNCEFLPSSTALHSGEISHPFFAIPQKKLISLAGDWAAGRFTIEQSYLLYLSLLDSTDLIDWRSQAEFTSRTPAILSSNMESLIRIIGKINLITHPSFSLPKFVISHSTRDLSNSHHWIEIWHENYNDWMQSQRDSRAQAEYRAKVETREAALDRLIRKSYAANPESMGKVLAEWAAVVGEFPESTTESPFTHRQIPLSEYWKQIIRAAHDEDKLWRFPRSDIVELQDYCHERIQNSGIRGHMLFKLLREGLENYDTYAGLANFEITRGNTPFKILNEGESHYNAAIQTLISEAPTSEPKRESYASQFAYIQAKMKWQIAQKRAKVSFSTSSPTS